MGESFRFDSRLKFLDSQKWGENILCCMEHWGLLWWLRQQRICLPGKRPWFDPWVGKILCRRKQQPAPVFLLGNSHGKGSLVGYCPWGCKELDVTEWLTCVCIWTHRHTYGAVEFSTQDPGKDTIPRYNILDSCSWNRNKEGGTWVSGSSLKKCFKYYDHILSMKNKYIYLQLQITLNEYFRSFI